MLRYSRSCVQDILISSIKCSLTFAQYRIVASFHNEILNRNIHSTYFILDLLQNLIYLVQLVVKIVTTCAFNLHWCSYFHLYVINSQAKYTHAF